MADTEQSIWYVVLPIMLTGIFSAVSWVVRGKYEHTKHLRSQYAFMKTELKLKNMKDKLEEFYWPIYLRLVRHLNYVKRFHKLSEGELQSEITPIEEHIDNSEFLPFTVTPTSLSGLSDTSPLETTDVHIGLNTNKTNETCSVVDVIDDSNDSVNDDNDDNSDESNEKKVDPVDDDVVINVTESELESESESSTCKLDLCVDDLIDEVKEMNNDIVIDEHKSTSNVVNKMKTAMRQRSKSKASDLFDSMKKRMNRLMNMKKSYNKQMLDNLKEVIDVFENKTAISSPDQELGANLLQLDSYVALYKSIHESGDYYNLPCKATHGIDFPFDIVRIFAVKLSEYQSTYDKLVDELDVFEDDERKNN